MKQSPTKVMQSSELARLAGISVDTLRYYERNRLLPAAQRSSSGYRLFPPEALMRVQMIRGALSVGFSIKELGQIFAVRDRGGIPCHQVRKLGTEKLDLVESQNPHTQMNERGEHGMGFSQTATAHHFLLRPDGGVIQVEVKDPKDTNNRGNIRMHLGHIAKMFASGDFDIPMFVHDAIPPGVPEMKQLQKSIHYTFEETPNGGRVVIATTEKTAIDAVHRFLLFQIKEHQTGDPQEMR